MSSKNFFLARNQFNNDPAHYTSIFAVMIVCFVCLFIVVTCYSMILYRIRKFHISNRSRRIFQQNLHRNQSSGISQKRPIIFQKGGRQQDAIVVEQIPPIRHSLKREFFSNTLSPKHLESPEKSQLKNSPSKRSVASGLSTLEEISSHEQNLLD
uniref:Uncharacterized protein n=1 Tax=Romanomermis culicivorax TaxID=13658 RepID=A0A915I7S8_ROMCU